MHFSINFSKENSTDSSNNFSNNNLNNEKNELENKIDELVNFNIENSYFNSDPFDLDQNTCSNRNIDNRIVKNNQDNSYQEYLNPDFFDFRSMNNDNNINNIIIEDNERIKKSSLKREKPREFVYRDGMKWLECMKKHLTNCINWDKVSNELEKNGFVDKGKPKKWYYQQFQKLKSILLKPEETFKYAEDEIDRMIEVLKIKQLKPKLDLSEQIILDTTNTFNKKRKIEEDVSVNKKIKLDGTSNDKVEKAIDLTEDSSN